MTQPKEGQLPYGTYGMLKSTIERFKDSTVPTNLNRHVLHDLSGGDFSALSTTLRFLNLINDDRSVRPEFRQLVAAAIKGDEAYQSAMIDLLFEAYRPVVGDFDVEAGTLPDLEKKFKDAGIPQGQMLTKTVRFYIKALEDCGFPVSEHITKPRMARTGKPKTAKAAKKAKQTTDDGKGKGASPSTGERADFIPDGFERLAMPGTKDAFIQYPSKLSKRDYDLFKAMLTVLGTYISLDENEEGKKP